jgi:hypothetical protein
VDFHPGIIIHTFLIPCKKSSSELGLTSCLHRKSAVNKCKQIINIVLKLRHKQCILHNMTLADTSGVGLSFILNMMSVHMGYKCSATNVVTSNDTKHGAYKLQVANRNYSY